MIILFYGQPASGKTTIAREFIKSMKDTWHDFIHIDGDEWRAICKNKDYSREGRISNMDCAFNAAKFLELQGFTPVLSFVAPYKSMRQKLSESGQNLIEIFLEYEGDRGRNHYFSKDFEAPDNNCLKLNTSDLSIDDCVHKVIEYIQTHKR